MTEKEKKADVEKVVKNITPDERKRIMIEGIKKTVAPAFISVFFALLFFVKFRDASEESWFSVILVVALISYYIQKFSYRFFGVKVEDFETKDWLYVEFFVVIYFWVFWTLLLNN